MTYIDNITVNGQNSQYPNVTTPPFIGGLYPIIIWEYVNNNADLGQVRYELKLSNINGNWGTDSFVGSLLDIDEDKSSNNYQWILNNLFRGSNYYGQIRGRDSDNNLTAWAKFSFNTNKLPFITSASLSPSSPSASDDIDIDYTYHDPDGHDQSGTKIRWFKDGRYQPAYDDLCILPSLATEAGESWSARIIPSDGLEYGPIVETPSVTILSVSEDTGIRHVQNVKVFPSDANVDDIMKVEYDIVETEYIPVEDQVVITWFVNNEEVDNSNQQYIRLNLNPGDEIYVNISLAGAETGNIFASSTSEIKIIKDVPWYVYNVKISGEQQTRNLPDLTPIITWDIHKTTAPRGIKPNYYRLAITKTEAIGGSIYDTGFIAYKTNYYQIPSGILKTGQAYYIHVGVSDTTDIDDNSRYGSIFIRIAGSSWENNVNNEIGWTLECRMSIETSYVESPFRNPYDEGSGQYTIFNTAYELMETNLPGLAVALLGSIESASLGNDNQSVESSTIGGLTVKRIYNPVKAIFPANEDNPSVTYDIYLSLDYENPYEEGDNKYVLWNNCVLAYNGMSIDARRAALSEGAVDLHIHDGTYYCSFKFVMRSIIFTSGENLTYTLPSQASDFSNSRTYRIEGKDSNLWMYIDNKLIMNINGSFNSPSRLKRLEIGDFSPTKNSSFVLYFFRYSTDGIHGVDNTISANNNFYFKEITKLKGGQVEYLTSNKLLWTPEDDQESTKLYNWNPNAPKYRLSTVNRSYSPITSIFIDSKRNKYVSTSNGVAAIYGEKHDPDYTFSTTGVVTTIPLSDFDCISNIPKDRIPLVTQNRIPDWFSIDTTYITSGISSPIDPYITVSHGIHYYSQRTHGHSWFDNVDNSKGWQVSFGFSLESLEADDPDNDNIDHHGVGFYINDGTRQEIIYFYQDRIRLYHANVYVPLDTTRRRDYFITGKDDNLKIFQKTSTESTGSYQLVLDATGLFLHLATKTGNSRKPKIIFGSDGMYHAVWHDDGNRRSKIMYSYHDGESWSFPELVTESTQFDLRNLDLDIDSSGRIWIVYEDTSWGLTELSVSVKDSAGWNPRIRLTNSPSEKSKPCIKIDPLDDVHVVWEDNRNGHWEIFWIWWQNSLQAWSSSGQFGEDTPIAQYDSDDPYQTGESVDFKNAKLSLAYPYLWIVFEFHDQTMNESMIYRGYRHLENNVWHNSGAVVTNTDNEVIAHGLSIPVSEAGRYCINPSISTNVINAVSYTIVAWEDHTEPVYQIWAQSFIILNDIGSNIQITNDIYNSYNSTVGAASNHLIIAYERDNKIYATMYNTSTGIFGSEQSINTDSNKIIHNPSLTISPAAQFRIVYDYCTIRNPDHVETIEFPEFDIIGDTDLQHDNNETITTLSDDLVSSLDTKEFAFGDMSETVGTVANWKNIKMYFGYDARPYSIVRYNSNSVNVWPDDRTFDTYVDIYGNIIAATQNGLIYHNIFTQKSVNVISNTPVKAIRWKKGIWYIIENNKIRRSTDAGQTWSDIATLTGANDLDLNNDYLVGIGTSEVYVYNISSNTGFTIGQGGTSIAIDEVNIIWVGTTNGIYRLENFSLNNILHFNQKNGMRSSYVHDIEVVNKNLRYLATATGVERMYGSKFTNFNVRNYEILNNNVYRVKYDATTNSLWLGSMHQLYEIVFRDPAHEIIIEEIIHYDSVEILTEALYDKRTYWILDVPQVHDTPIVVAEEAGKVFINWNPIDFGYTFDAAESVAFICDLLINDEIEVEVSNLLDLVHDFNQLGFESEIEGHKRTIVTKLARTSTNRDFYLAKDNNNDCRVLLDAGTSNIPFTTILIDVDKPEGCIEKLETLSRTEIRFKIIAYDAHSGVESFMLSNNPEFKEDDGITNLEWKPIVGSIVHNIGESLNNVVTSLTLPSTVVIANVTYTVGYGSKLGVWIDETHANKQVLIGVTNQPVVSFKYDDEHLEWNVLEVLDPTDATRIVTTLKQIGTSLYMTTETNVIGKRGDLRRMTNGVSFEILAEISDQSARGITEVNGLIYFGSGNGKIYAYDPSTARLETIFSDVGESVYSLDSYRRFIFVGTSKQRTGGVQGQLYSVNLDSNDNIAEFIKSGTLFGDILIENSGNNQPSEDFIFVACTNLTEIYHANMEDRMFRKSYTSYGTTVNKLGMVDINIIDSREEGRDVVVAVVGSTLLYYVNPSWEYVYRYSENINDFVEFSANEKSAIWFITDTAIVRWEQITEESTKTIYARFKDKAGNISTINLDENCPQLVNNELVGCCQSYSISIQDLQDFINESRLLDVAADGSITYSFDSPTGIPIYSGDKIDYEEGIYVSEIFNGSTNLVSWRSITWISTEPTNTSVRFQVRSATSEDDILIAEWSPNLVPIVEIVSLEHITNQYIQFRAVLVSRSRGISPTLTSVTIRNITTQSSHFFTTNFILPSRPIKGLVTANTYIPVAADIIFGITTKNTTNFADYQVVEVNRLFQTKNAQFEPNLRIGARLLSPAVKSTSEPSDDPYETDWHNCSIIFTYTNNDLSSHDYHFRIKFYNDIDRTQLIYTFFTGNDQTGWQVNNHVSDIFPAIGLSIIPGSHESITFVPVDLVESNQRWYLIIEAYDGSSFEIITSTDSYVCATCKLTTENKLIAEYYQTGLPVLTAIPTFSQYTPDYVILENEIDFFTVGEWISTNGTILSGYSQNYAVRFRGKIHAPNAGTYVFYLTSCDGSRLYMNGIEILDNDGTHSVETKSGNIELGQGFHDLEVHYFKNGAGNSSLKLEWVIPGTTVQTIVPPERLYHSIVSEYCVETGLPKIYNFAVLFELESGETVKLNLNS